RVIAVVVQVSSRKISRPPRLVCALRHASRRSATSGRCCSLACTVFFEADALGGEEARQHRLVGCHAVRAKQTPGDRTGRQIVLLAPQLQEPVPVRLQHRTAVPAGWQSCRAARLLERAHPTNRARDPHPENPRRLVPRKTVLNDSLDHPNPKSLSMRHPCRPPPGHKDESRFALLGNPFRLSSTPTRSNSKYRAVSRRWLPCCEGGDDLPRRRRDCSGDIQRGWPVQDRAKRNNLRT